MLKFYYKFNIRGGKMRGYILSFLGNFYLRIFKLEKALKCYELALKHNTKNFA